MQYPHKHHQQNISLLPPIAPQIQYALLMCIIVYYYSEIYVRNLLNYTNTCILIDWYIGLVHLIEYVCWNYHHWYHDWIGSCDFYSLIECDIFIDWCDILIDTLIEYWLIVVHNFNETYHFWDFDTKIVPKLIIILKF